MVRTVKVSSVTTCEWHCVTHQHFPLGAFESELFPLVTKGFAALSSEAAGFSSWNSLLEAAQQSRITKHGLKSKSMTGHLDLVGLGLASLTILIVSVTVLSFLLFFS